MVYEWDDAGNVTRSTTAINGGRLNVDASERIKIIEIDTGQAPARGLRGEYYENRDFTSLKSTRIDPVVHFWWNAAAPVNTTITSGDTFSVRWKGEVEAPATGRYTFTTRTDDGVRLWVNGNQLINDWNDHAMSDRSAGIDLVAGQRYSIQMDYYENGGGAGAKLSWAYPGQAKQVIPQARLYPAGE